MSLFAAKGPDQNDQTHELHDFQWAPFRDASDQLSDFGSYSVYPSPSILQPQASPQPSSYSWDGSTDAARTWNVETPGTVGYFSNQRDATSPRTQGSSNQAQLYNDQSRTPAFDTQLPLLDATRPSFAWTVTGNPSESRLHVHAPVARSRSSSLNPRRIESSVRQRRANVEADPSSAILPSAKEKLLHPSTKPSVTRQSQSPSTNPSESPSPTQSVASDPGRSKSQSTGGKRKKPRRKAHNAIERRYRSKLNEKIAGLRDSIPSLRTKVESEATRPGGSFDPTGGSNAASKVNKADVLEKATEYVKHLEDANRRLEAQLQETLTRTREGSMRGSPASAFPLAQPRQDQGPSLQSEHHPAEWYLQSPRVSTHDYELLQHRLSKSETIKSHSVFKPPEHRLSPGNSTHDTSRRSS